VISADEKTSIQALIRCHPSTPPAAGRAMRVEHEYERGGAVAYLAVWDVHRAKIFGRCEPTTGIVPFGRLVDQVMSQPPYRSARRVFWIVDNGSSHHGLAEAKRLKQAWPAHVLVHTPVHASWLNQVEIYFSIVQRKVLTPTTSAAGPRSKSVCCSSTNTMNKSLSHFIGLSRGATSKTSSRRFNASRTSPLPRDDSPGKIRHRHCDPQH
jgi:hypothetical protein